jgi:drug/metabolite transporter (DMT)-like permease
MRLIGETEGSQNTTDRHRYGGPMELAYLAALACALCYGVGSILEDVAAKRATDVAGAMKQPIYVAGLGLDLVGWLLSLLALQRLPLFAVQAAVASSVAVTVVLAALVLHDAIGRRQIAALAAMGVGLVLLALSAAPDRPASISDPTTAALIGGVALVALLGLAAKAGRGPRIAGVLGALSGLGFGGTAVCARALEADGTLTDVLTDPLTIALLAYGALGLVLFTMALERGSVTVATASQFAAETVVPAVIGLLVLGDSARHGLAWAAAGGFVLTVGGSVALTVVSPPEPQPGQATVPPGTGATRTA